MHKATKEQGEGEAGDDGQGMDPAHDVAYWYAA